jgi:hypothetical protein
MAGDDCPGSDQTLEERLMCAQKALEQAQAEANTAKKVATEALRLMTPEQVRELSETLGELDVLGGFGRADV